MAIEIVDSPERQRFDAVVDGVVGGFSEYELGDGRITFTHTEVSDEFEGQGVGGALVRGALDEVRRRGLTVVARCPFVKGWIEHHPDYHDLLAG